MDILNLEEVRPEYREEVELAAARALRAGAPARLEWVGMGAYGIVFCDDADHAWKVFRVPPEPDEQDLLFVEGNVTNEYEWLRAAARTPAAKYVAAVYGRDLEHFVLERECIRGRPGGWADASMLHTLHREIEKETIQVGWTAPEFKEDSYVFGPRGPVLVDISMVQRIGPRLLRFVRDVLAGRRRTRDRWHDLAFYVVREVREKTITKDEAVPVLRKLVELDPEIAEGFTMPEGVVSRVSL